MDAMRLANFFSPRRKQESSEETNRLVRDASEAREEALSILAQARSIHDEVMAVVKKDHLAPLDGRRLPQFRGRP